ncbi:MAG: response regulator, partial [Synechococcales bacterium]|nr:response regulator [Synechococcales bacterium]
GYQVLQASDGVEALSYLHQHPQVNAIICDIEMPQMNGFQFLNQTRNSATFAHIPILMLTSRTSPKHRQIALELGATGYLTKPYSPKTLLSALNSLSIPVSPPASVF